ncbi:MAG: hypothetical protein ACE366_07390 [Bradymonadia bacterium]
MKHLLCTLTGLALWAWALSAHAITLQYDEEADVRGCPGAQRLTRRIESLLASPQRHASATISVHVSRDRRTLFADITDDEGGQRRLAEPSGRCRLLNEAVAVAVAAALEPITLPAPPVINRPTIGVPTLGERIPSSDLVGIQALPERIGVGRSSPPRQWWLSGGGGIFTGVAPGTAPGLMGTVGMSRRPWSFALEGRLMRSFSRDTNGGRIESDSALGGAWGCRMWGLLRACAGGVAGVIFARGEGFVSSSEVTAPFLAPGLRGAFRWPRSGPIALDLWAEGLVPLSRVRLSVDDAQAWESAPATFGAGLEAVLRFF